MTQKSILIVTFCFLLLKTLHGQNNRHSQKTETVDSIKGVYIPKDLYDCFIQLNHLLSDSSKREIKNKDESMFSAESHHGMGLWMRNNWGLWAGSRLSKYFNGLGIQHPDDMSGIILDSYHRHLNNKDIRLKEQTDHIKFWWKVSAEPSKNKYPRKAKDVEFNTKMYYTLQENGLPGCVHVQTNSTTDKVWLYDLHFGWKLLPKESINELDESTEDNREMILRKLFGQKS